MKKIILRDREERRERRRLLAELTAPKIETVTLPENGERPSNVESVKPEELQESDLLISENVSVVTKVEEVHEFEVQNSKNETSDENVSANFDADISPNPVDPAPALTDIPDSQNLVGHVMKEILEETPLQKAKRSIHSRKFRE